MSVEIGTLETYLRKKRSEGRKLVVPYITGGFKGWTDAIRAAAANGADAIEIGIPFSDPVMDGPTIQHASEMALRNGVNANLLRHWMKLGHWQSGTPTLLPVTVLAQQPCADVVATTLAQPFTGPVEIELCGAVIRLSGQVDAAQLRTVVTALRA